ncbi:TcdA/TcdB catalytic glycosyltransferase domain-containing protein [Photobacterium damselae]|nr:TcdA/TcdB catalytic glycosyltransferase domain-containing protein [Photobacterium damselae]
MTIYNNIPWHRIVHSIDNCSNKNNEKLIIKIINSLNRKSMINQKDLIEIERIFFIWIGAINSKSIEYIEIWKDCYKNRYTIDLYIDGEFLLFNHLKMVFNRLYNITSKTPIDMIVAYQNELYQELYMYSSLGYTFDKALIIIADRVGINLRLSLKLVKLKILAIKKQINVIDIRTINNIFYSDFLAKMYYNELTLRYNAACASDILRLSLLYHYGGMYVDVDTLPTHFPVYSKIDVSNMPVNENMLDIIKSEYLLRQIRKRNGYSIKKNICLDHIEATIGNAPLIRRLKLCAKTNANAVYQQDRVFVHPDIMRMATINRYYEVNNNVLIANRSSRSVRIVLREMTKRYKYLACNNLIFSTESNRTKSNNYLCRLDGYRLDSLANNITTEVTLLLTGPCLIQEVLLGLCFEVCNLSKSLSPHSVSYIFRLERSFLGFANQINYTPEHIRSSWL